MANHEQQIFSLPFQELLQERFAIHEARTYGEEFVSGPGPSPASLLARECGWEGDAGMRRLYRFRYGKKSTNRAGRKLEVPTFSFPRATVEEALHNLGFDLFDLYGEYAERMAGLRGRPCDVLRHIEGFLDLFEDPILRLVPTEAFCERCQDIVFLDASGACQWCAGAKEFRAELDKRGRERARESRRTRGQLREAA